MSHSKINGILKALGPGLVFAGASIGVSHIVQSTRAGAIYGFALLGVVIVVNIIKFPFFEFGPRYVAAMNENLLQGYKRRGNIFFYLFVVLTLLTMFPVQAAVTLVTTGLFINLLGIQMSLMALSAFIFLVCIIILMVGRYALLDKAIKVMICILGMCTIVAFIAAVINGSSAQPDFSSKFVFNFAGISFLLALMGWMPAPIDISVWHSIWCAERRKQTQHEATLKETQFDFHLGYWGTMMMAVLFVCLGALTMYGTGEVFSDSAVKFTGQVVSLYTKALGDWSYSLIVTAAALTMFSTTLTCLDAYSRVMKEVAILVRPSIQPKAERVYFVWMIVLAFVSVMIIGLYIHKMKALVDLATILSFLAAPVLAYMNLKIVTGSEMPIDARPSQKLIAFSWFGIVFLSLFSLWYLGWRILH